eukprot:gene11254-13135_t
MTIAAIAVSGIVISSCSRQVTRVSTDETIDVSGNWNNSDSRMVAQELTQTILSGPWLGNHLEQNAGKKPTVIVGMVQNKSHEHIEAETFVKDVETAFIQTQRVRLVQGGKKREELRAEKADQQANATVSSMKKFGLENGADYILQGSINSIVDSHKRLSHSMKNILNKILRASGLFGLMLFLFSCASYNDRIMPYYTQVAGGNYKQAAVELDKNSLLKKPRNKLLLLMEKGKISHLEGDYESSNRYFNEADQLLEDGIGGVMDAAVGTLVNPMTQSYKGEDFEKFMIHYYKALNYFYLNNTEDAIVEARRITLQSQEQGDKFNNKESRYSKDAFSLMLQGLIYEAGRNVNDAFIAYRNAADVYLTASDTTYYGTKIPEGLKKDLIRTAYLNGFQSEQDKYERLFNLKYQAQKSPEGGELILFWENGLAPIKKEKEFFFSLIKNNHGDMVFTDGNIVIPFFDYDPGKVNKASVQSLRVTYPMYVARPPYFNDATASNGTFSIPMEKVEDINVLAFKTLDQRFAKEMGKTLARLAVKKTAEYILSESGKGSGKNGKNDALLTGLGYGMQLYSLLSEKSDTRNWQTLPNSISYARIPLQKGENTISLSLKGSNGQNETKTIQVNGTGNLKFYNYSSLR